MHRILSITYILRAAAIMTIVIGLVTLIFPDMLVRIFDGYSGSNYHFVRYIGTALLGFGFMNWIYSTFEDLTAVLPAIYGNLLSLVIAIVIDAYGIMVRDIAPQAFVILLVHVVFAWMFLHAAREIISSNT